MRRAATTMTRYGATRGEIEALLSEWGEPRYRAAQAWQGLWEQRRPLEAITVLPRALRDRLASALPLALERMDELTDDRGRTRKWRFACRDGAEVETVLMEYPTRATVCVSSQAGCAMDCAFCATGQAGFERNLDPGEILEQVLRASHASSTRVGNIVYMGMGEPLANFDAVWASVERLHADLGISARHLTISTIGLVPGIERLAATSLPVTLAVSLHAPDDRLREQLVPVNRRYPISEVIASARVYAATKGRRVTFEYACIAGLNDDPARADALARLLRGFLGGAHVNLIALNPTVGFEGRRPDRARLEAFAARLRRGGVGTTIRATRGGRIDAACGQLRRRVTGPAPASDTMVP